VLLRIDKNEKRAKFNALPSPEVSSVDVRNIPTTGGGDYIAGIENKESSKNSMERIIREFTPNEEAMAKNRENLAQANSVAELTGNEFGKSETGLFDQVSNYFDSVGNSVYNEELGDIGLSRRGVRDDIAHGVGRLKAITFAAVPDVLKNGTIISYTENHKGRGYDTAIIAAPVNIGDSRHYVAAVVIRSYVESDNVDSQRFYLHEVHSDKKTSELFKTVWHLLRDVGYGSSNASTYNIGDSQKNVNS